uniref:Uncharacterized protein n=1 Tax=Arundo donax TaxID=35708 RepID=A0A0A9T0Z8_ARUDO
MRIGHMLLLGLALLEISSPGMFPFFAHATYNARSYDRLCNNGRPCASCYAKDRMIVSLFFYANSVCLWTCDTICYYGPYEEVMFATQQLLVEADC